MPKFPAPFWENFGWAHNTKSLFRGACRIAPFWRWDVYFPWLESFLHLNPPYTLLSGIAQASAGFLQHWYAKPWLPTMHNIIVMVLWNALWIGSSSFFSQVNRLWCSWGLWLVEKWQLNLAVVDYHLALFLLNPFSEVLSLLYLHQGYSLSPNDLHSGIKTAMLTPCANLLVTQSLLLPKGEGSLRVTCYYSSIWLMLPPTLHSHWI